MNTEKKTIEKLMPSLSEKNSDIFVNSRGMKIKLRPLPPYLVQIATESIVRPEIPTYSIKTESGDIETHQHDEKSISQSNDEEKLKWAEYIEETKKVNVKISTLMIDIVLMEGIDAQIENEQRWIKRQQLMGITVPEDPEEKLLMYKKTCIISTPEDIAEITRKVMSLTGVSTEDIEKLKDSFPSDTESQSSEGERNSGKES